MTRFGIALSFALLSVGRSEDWPQFRGPNGTGVSVDSPIPLEWSSDKHIAWKAPVPGAGWSQPVIVGNLVFVTSAITDRPRQPKDYASGTADPYTISGGSAPPPDGSVDWRVFALELRTGVMRWQRSVASGKSRYPIHPSSTYANETPAADERAVYVFFGAIGMLVGFDHEGQMLWRRELGVYRQQNNTGAASSPRLFGGLLYLQCFNEEQAFLVCLEAKSGREKWRIVRDEVGTSWSTPLIWRNECRTELIAGGPKLMTSHDPLTGKELWRASGTEMPLIASISADTQHLYFGSRSPTQGGALYAFNAGLEGAQRLDPRQRISKGESWRAPDAAPGMPSPIVAAGCVYTLNEAVLTCVEAATGRQHYHKRLPGFRSVVASPVAVGNKVVIIDESGNAVVLRAGPEFEILGQSRLEDRFWASPATSNGMLLLRGLEHVYCIRQ